MSLAAANQLKDASDVQTPRRLLLVVQRLGNMGGQERSTLELVTRLVRLGWRLELLSFVLSDWPPELPIAWRRVPSSPLRFAVAENLWFALWVAPRVRRWRRVHGGAEPAVVMTIGTASPTADVRVLQFVHGAALRKYQQHEMPYPNARGRLRMLYQALFARLEAGIERRLLPRSRQLVAISQGVAADARADAGVPATLPVAVVPHAADIIPREPDMRLTAEPVRILFVGALERKGIEKALRTLQLVGDLSWRFCAVGGGNLSKWRHLAAELGIATRVEFTGPVPARGYFARHDIFLFPSVYEPFGLVVAEAVGFGLAPLVSRECGAMEQWPERPAWLDLSCGDEAAHWAQSLRRLLTQPAERAMVAAAARDAMARWTWDKVALSYDQILGGVAAHREGRAA